MPKAFRSKMQTIPSTDKSKFWHALTVFLLVFAVCMVGISSRPNGCLAVFWPANALLLAVLVRNPKLATRYGWGMAAVGYLLADLLTGSSFDNALLLNSANIVGVGLGYLLFMRLQPPIRTLQRGPSSMYLFGICLASAACAALVGAGASSLLYDWPYFSALSLWFSSEFINYITLMPFILAFPTDWQACLHRLLHWRHWPGVGRRFAVLALLPLACVCSVLIGGPGAVIFPMPVLLWLAMSFPLFGTMIAVLSYVLWCHLAIDLGLVATNLDMKVLQNIVSMRLGVALLALGPIAVASVNFARDTVLSTLEYVANHDALTQVLTRSAFMQRGERLIAQKGELLCVMMLDIDYFKSINDRFGHAGGDAALLAFTRAIAANLRESDLFGRMGGEEFAIVASLGQRRQAMRLAERLRQQIEREWIVLPGGNQLQITVSIGMVTCVSGAGESLDELLKMADMAVYKAKNGGRNQVATPEIFPLIYSDI